jgi:hypothetical protein
MKRWIGAAAALLLLLTAGVPAATAAPPEAIRFDVRVALAGDLTASTTRGTFVASGAVSDSGLEVGSGRFAGLGHLKTGEPNALKAEMTLTGADGTIEIYLVGTFGTLPAPIAEGNGHWWMGEGTGAYAGLHARGSWTAQADFRAAIAHTGPPIVTFVDFGTAN